MQINWHARAAARIARIMKISGVSREAADAYLSGEEMFKNHPSNDGLMVIRDELNRREAEQSYEAWLRLG